MCPPLDRWCSPLCSTCSVAGHRGSCCEKFVETGRSALVPSSDIFFAERTQFLCSNEPALRGDLEPARGVTSEGPTFESGKGFVLRIYIFVVRFARQILRSTGPDHVDATLFDPIADVIGSVDRLRAS